MFVLDKCEVEVMSQELMSCGCHRKNKKICAAITLGMRSWGGGSWGVGGMPEIKYLPKCRTVIICSLFGFRQLFPSYPDI